MWLTSSTTVTAVVDKPEEESSTPAITRATRTSDRQKGLDWQRLRLTVSHRSGS
jgi:hypothetical protein